MSTTNQPPRDLALTNLAVRETLTVKGKLVSNAVWSVLNVTSQLNIPGGNSGDVLVNDGNGNAAWSNQVSFLTDQVTNTGVDTYQQTKLNKTLNFNLSNLTSFIAAGDPLPSFPTGRTITLTNLSSVAIDVYLTVGYPTSSGATLLTTLSTSGGESTLVWDIPSVYGWSGNFAGYVSGTGPFQGSTLAEFGLNQVWTGFSPVFRDTFDISTVPPGIGSSYPNGPRSSCVALSQQNGFSVQQSYGYNVGIEIIPSNAGSLEFQTVTCTSTNGDSDDAVTYPNDTAYPKQQTVECLNNASYTVNFKNPTFST
jgi:hypothetical protein